MSEPNRNLPEVPLIARLRALADTWREGGKPRESIYVRWGQKRCAAELDALLDSLYLPPARMDVEQEAPGIFDGGAS